MVIPREDVLSPTHRLLSPLAAAADDVIPEELVQHIDHSARRRTSRDIRLGM